jgi:hypothetical protein
MNVIENVWAVMVDEWNEAHEKTPREIEAHCH